MIGIINETNFVDFFTHKFVAFRHSVEYVRYMFNQYYQNIRIAWYK